MLSLLDLAGIGDDAPDAVEDIEIIFNPISELGDALEGFASLRSLTLMSTGLRRMSGLDKVSATLTRLALPNQKITKMESLALPNLVELFLQGNAISKIEGLSMCKRLQKLWLCGNQVSRIENLHNQGALRELWLQNNKISRIGRLEYLANLQSLGLARNRIADFKDLRQLSCLPMLCDLSLQDNTFGAMSCASLRQWCTHAITHSCSHLPHPPTLRRCLPNCTRGWLSHVCGVPFKEIGRARWRQG